MLVVVFFCGFAAETVRRVRQMEAGRGVLVIGTLVCIVVGLGAGAIPPAGERGQRPRASWWRFVAPWAIAAALMTALWFWPDPIVRYALLMTSGWCFWGVFAMGVWRAWPAKHAKGDSKDG
jgi:hypothetical protein